MKLRVLSILLLTAACASTPTCEPLDAPIRVLLLGDSISIGYTLHVREALGADALVVRPTNAKGGAENCAGTTKGVEHVDRWLVLEGGDWDVIHFNFGLHDLKRVEPDTGKNSNDPEHPHQAPPERYREQLREITAKLAASHARLVFATTTPVPLGGVKPHRDPEDVARFNAIALEVMGEFEVEVDDLYAFALPRMDALMRPVNVHFTPEGSAALGDEVARSIRAVAGWDVHFARE